MMPDPLLKINPEWTPRRVEPGPETRALSKFLWDGTWTGTVVAGGMGPGSPEMEGKGRAVCTWILDNLWLSCHFEQDQFVNGKKILTWKAEWIIGWDVTAREYRAVGVDNNGVAFIFHGTVNGDRLVMESLGDLPVMLRFTWEKKNPETMNWKNEMSAGGNPWSLIEEYDMRPDGKRQ